MTDEAETGDQEESWSVRPHAKQSGRVATRGPLTGSLSCFPSPQSMPRVPEGPAASLPTQLSTPGRLLEGEARPPSCLRAESRRGDRHGAVASGTPVCHARILESRVK